MKLKLKNVKPNPFRDMDKHPLREEKIETLTNSIDSTEFWENIVARDMGDGTIQIAHGHHRVEVLRNIYGDEVEFDFIIKDLADSDMLKFMVTENMSEWNCDSAVEQEEVRAVVQAYADGLIELVELPAKTSKNKIRCAPSFMQGLWSKDSCDHPYVTCQIAEFMGWKEWKVKETLAALESQEKTGASSNLEGLDGKQQAALNKQVEKVDKIYQKEIESALSEGDELAARSIEKTGKAAVSRVEKSLHKGLVDGSISIKELPSEANRIAFPVEQDKEFPDIYDVASKYAIKISGLMDEEKKLGQEIRELIKYRSKIADNVQRSLYMSLIELADEATELAQKFKVKKEAA